MRNALVTLRDACREAERVLVAHPATAAALASAGRDVTDLPRYLAEYTINGLVELPSGYSLREMWALEGASLLAPRSGELAKQSTRSTRPAAPDAPSRSTTTCARPCSLSRTGTGLQVIDLEVPS